MSAEIENQIASISAAIRVLIPISNTIAFQVREDGSVEITVFNLPTSDAGTELLRKLGIGERSKLIIDDQPRAWHSLSGRIGEHSIQCFCDGLPKSCHIEIFTEKIPKNETVETGEFVEIQRRRIVCGESKQEAA